MSDNNAYSQAVAQANSIIEMVGALNVDYERFNELRDEQHTIRNLGTVEELAAFDSEFSEELDELFKEANGNEDEDSAREAIQNDPLSVEVRAAWHSPTTAPVSPDEFMILLCTGGPAVRIVGELNDYLEPCSARIEYQDWFEPWKRAESIIAADVLLTYCQQFYFGE